MVSPASTRPLPFTSTGVPACLTRLTISSPWIWVAVLSGWDCTLTPNGLVAVAMAVLSTVPASTSD